MCDIAKRADLLWREQGEGPASALDAINPLARNIKDILQVAGTERGVVRCTDFRHAESTWLLWTVCAWNEVEGYVMWNFISHDFLLSGKMWRKRY